eukprot:EG_transcript_24892
MAFVRLTSGEVVRTGNAATRRLLSRYAQKQTAISSSKRETGLKAHLKELEKDMAGDFELEGIDPDAFLPDTDEPRQRKRKRRHANKPRWVLEEVLRDELSERAVAGETKLPWYATAAAGPSKLPPRRFCSVCGFRSPYTCTKCGARFCSVRCKGVHDDQRCMKAVG